MTHTLLPQSILYSEHINVVRQYQANIQSTRDRYEAHIQGQRAQFALRRGLLYNSEVVGLAQDQKLDEVHFYYLP